MFSRDEAPPREELEWVCLQRSIRLDNISKRERTMKFFVLVVVVLLSACGTTLPGKLYSLHDGTAMEFQIERSYGTGGMSAQNLKTGESFSGQYTGTYKGGGTATTIGRGSYTGSTSNYATGSMYQHSGSVNTTSTTFIPPRDATARGVLVGDKGTVIELYMEIRPGIVPKGHGEGIDNKGIRYQVQF